MNPALTVLGIAALAAVALAVADARRRARAWERRQVRRAFACDYRWN